MGFWRIVNRAALTASLAVLLAALSCDDDPTVQPCRDIPAGGCPISHGIACEDPSCDAIYACRPGNVWELQQRCPARPAASPVDASADRSESAPPPNDASIDAPPGAFGGPGCASLQLPDCALGVALACPNGCCECEDLFVCEDRGWTLWGTCGDAGIVRTP